MIKFEVMVLGVRMELSEWIKINVCWLRLTIAQSLGRGVCPNICRANRNGEFYLGPLYLPFTTIALC